MDVPPSPNVQFQLVMAEPPGIDKSVKETAFPTQTIVSLASNSAVGA